MDSQSNPHILPLIAEVNRLWDPVYPYLTEYFLEIYRRTDGHILEVGPFSGSIFALIKKGIGERHGIGAFPGGMAESFHAEAKRWGLSEKATVIPTNQSLKGIDDGSADLLIFRGALFFPSLFGIDYQAISRVLKEGGIAFIGGGFGRLTPPSVILNIGKRSKELNLLIGKVEMTEADLQREIRSAGVAEICEISTDGGLWLIMRKEELLPAQYP